MDMLNVIICTLLSVVLVWIVCRLAAFLIVIASEKFLGISVKIGSIGFLTFGKVQCKVGQFLSIDVGKVWLTSSYLSKDANKPVNICVAGVRIQVDIAKRTEFGRKAKQQQKQSEHRWLKFVQMLGINLDDIVLILHGPESYNCLVDIKDVVAHCSNSQPQLQANISVKNVSCKVLKGTGNQNITNCLCELTLSTTLYAEVDEITKNITACDLAICRPTLNITEGFLAVLRDYHLTSKTTARQEESTPRKYSSHLLPQRSSVVLEQVEVVVSKETAALRCVNFKVAQTDLTCQKVDRNFNAKLTVSDVHIFSQQANIANMKHFKLEAKADEEVVVLIADADQCFLGYHHEEWQYWHAALFQKIRDRSKLENIEPPKALNEPAQPFLSFFRRRRLKLSLVGKQLSFALASAGCSGLKAGICNLNMQLALNPTQQGENLIMERDCKLEVEVGSMYCKTAENAVSSVELNSKQHHRNVLLYVGILIIKGNIIGNESHLDSLVDSIQVELAAHSIGILSKISSFFTAYVPKMPTASKSNIKPRCNINSELNNMNMYIVAENHACCMVRINLLSYKSGSSGLEVSVKATKMTYQPRIKEVTAISRCQDLPVYAAYLKLLKVNIVKSDCEICLTEDVQVSWTYGLHMTMHEVMKEAVSLIQGIISKAASSSPPVAKQSLNVCVQIPTRSNVTLLLTNTHSVSFQCVNVVFKKSINTTFGIQALTIFCDHHEVIKAEKVCVDVESQSSLPMKLQRIDLKQASNRTVRIAMDQLQFIFPHQYRFCDCYQEVICLNKWRKIHYPPSSKGTLPPDIVINIATVSLQICDDPFEVKLGDNQELLRDEQRENEKRMSAMDKRVQELRKQHGLLPASKVVELYTTLQKKSATVYIQRSIRLYTSSPIRTRLYIWTMTDFQITAMADSSFNGKDNVISIMREIDHCSPYPDGLEYSTLWCRLVKVDVASLVMQLRDYALPMLDISGLHLWGRLVAAEKVAPPTARRSCTIKMEDPWPDVTVVRNMQPLKFFHDFSSDVQSYCMTYGPCWEPAVAYWNQAVNFINKPSVDPSTPLPFWDKSRLLFHGRLTMCVEKMRWLYHASLDPYNKTELMDWTWTNLLLDWTNAKWVLKGDLDIYARTASKYDDCRLLHLPNLRLCIKLEWLCDGDPNDHHSISPCAPDKVPQHPNNKKHDSYETFRSRHLNMSVSFETSEVEGIRDVPSCLFYNSTLRWMDKIKMCMVRVARPIKRGKLFNLLVPRKPQLSRHYKKNTLSMKIHEFEVCYWVSFSKQHGTEMRGKEFSMNLGMELNLVSMKDELCRRPRADWRIRQFICNLGATTIYLCSGQDLANMSLRAGPVNKSYFLSLEKVCYQRAEELPPTVEQDPEENLSTHKIQIYNCKASWTLSNRNVGISLYDAVLKAQNLKKNLSSAALKGFKVDNVQTPVKGPRGAATSPDAFSPSPLSKIQSGPTYNMLTKLVSESDSKFFAAHEELAGGNVPLEELHGIAACQTDDVLSRNWHIELINSQALLRGVENKGYVLVSTGKTSILSCDHKQVWRDQQLKSKTTWVGSVESMQYYATVDPGEDDDEENVMWLSQDQIQQATDHTLLGLESMVGSSQTVGGVITERSTQLQRIISRCKCQFFFVSYGDPDSTHPVFPETAVTDMLGSTEEGVDSFSLLHHDLNICTNSPQYLMILDIVNNLLLHTEPKKKELLEKVQNMRFELHFTKVEDQRTPILQLQNNLREYIATMRKLEKELYLSNKGLDEQPDDTDLLLQIADLEGQMEDLKEQINVAGDHLAVMVSAFKESQLMAQAQAKHTTANTNQEAPLSRRIELCFKHAEWRMTDTDGQIGIADLVLRNFLYTKLNRDDDSGSHQVELGFVKVTNLQPNTIYKDVLGPHDPHGQGFSDKQSMLRVLCKFKAPVGGISIREHFEVNVIPLQLQLTKRFYNTVMKFFFPGKSVEAEADSSDDEMDHNTGSSIKRRKASKASVSNSNFYVDDIDKMKERAAKNNMFLYIKIPEVPLRVSYKGLKDKNISDVHEFTFLLPTLEYHNTTWTWLDLLLAMKNDSKKVLISQAIKQKLHLKSRSMSGDQSGGAAGQEMQEDHKAKLLFGAKFLGGGEKSSSKKSLFSKAPK